MKIDSPRFGSLEVDPAHVIEFPLGLAGFEDCRRFSLFHPEGEQPSYFILQSIDEPETAFHIADPAQFGLNYDLTLSDEEAVALAITDAERRVARFGARLAVAMIVSKPGIGLPVKPNRTGPLVINLETRRGLQKIVAAD